MKADTGAGRISATRSMSPIPDDAGSRHKGVSRLDHGRPLSAEHRMKKSREEEERKDSRFELIVAIEQWICLVLGVVCIASGIWGALLKVGQNGSPAHLAGLGSAYVPALRATAVGCLVMGLVLVRRGLTRS
jgi:hypothetical protein